MKKSHLWRVWAVRLLERAQCLLSFMAIHSHWVHESGANHSRLSVTREAFTDSPCGRCRDVSLTMVITLALGWGAVFICWLQLQIPWSVSGSAGFDVDWLIYGLPQRSAPWHRLMWRRDRIRAGWLRVPRQTAVWPALLKSVIDYLKKERARPANSNECIISLSFSKIVFSGWEVLLHALLGSSSPGWDEAPSMLPNWQPVGLKPEDYI